MWITFHNRTIMIWYDFDDISLIVNVTVRLNAVVKGCPDGSQRA
jgi:hypothetical protein